MVCIITNLKKIVIIQKEIQMARTKQTARLSCAQKVPRMAIKASRVGRRGRGRGPRSPSKDSSSSEPQYVAQQFSVKFDNQPDCQKKAIKGKLFECKNCKAYLSSSSELQKMEGQMSSSRRRASRQKTEVSDAKKQEINSKVNSLWQCQFCATKNEVPGDIEIPKEQNPCYFLDKDEKEIKRSSKEGREKMIVYCIDISGSMDTQFEGKTRLEAVKEGIRDQIKRMKAEGQKIKVAVVTFGSVVSVKIKKDNVAIPNHLYYDFEGIAAFASKISKEFALPVQTHHSLFEGMINQMVTYGCTALGPALVTSIELASRVRGSKIVFCTDGQANIGLLGPDFYTKAADFAKEKGVMISILSIKGDRCNLKQLGKLTLSTGGSILKIDPTLLGSEFNKISKEKVFGTQSHLRIVVNHFFEILHADPNNLSENKTILSQDFGNFTEDTQLTFDFRQILNQEAIQRGVSMNILKRKRLPMQVQLTYTNPDGERYIQVINDYREVTEDRNQLLSETNFSLFSSSTLQKVSKLIKEENFTAAEAEISRFRSLVNQLFATKEKKEDLDKFGGRIDALERVLKSKKNKKQGKSIPRQHLVAQKIARKGAPSESKEKKTKSKVKRRNRSRSSSSQNSECSVMSSDSEAQVLWKEMRARSRSRSP